MVLILRCEGISGLLILIFAGLVIEKGYRFSVLGKGRVGMTSATDLMVFDFS